MRKSKYVVFLVVLAIAAGPLAAQTTAASSALADVVSVRDLDLTSASLHQAGPTSFYVRSVGIERDLYSLTFSQDANGIWALTSLNPESENILPARTVLDFASLTATDDDTLQIDGVFVDGQVYAGSISVGESGDVSLAGSIQAGSVDEVNNARALALAELAVTETAAAFREELEEQRAELQAIIDQIEEERDGYKSERDALAQTRTELEAERDSLAQQLATSQAAAVGDGFDINPPVTVADGSPLTSDQVNSVLRERDQLAGDMVGLLAENNQLRDEKRTLSEQIADLQAQNETLRSELVSMTAEVQRLTDLVEAYRSASDGTADVSDVAESAGTTDTADAGSTDAAAATHATDTGTADAATATAADATESGSGTTPVWNLPGDYLRKSDLEAAAASVTAELRELENRVAELEAAAAGLAGLEAALRSGISESFASSVRAPDQPGTLMGSGAVPEPDASEEAIPAPDASVEVDDGALAAARAAAERAQSDADAEVREISAELAVLVEQNEQLKREARELENRILNDILSNGLVAMMSERLTQTVNAGFTGSTPDVGSWSVTANRAVQSDSDAFFAKLAVPAVQANGPVLYSFRVRSTDPEGWVGVGLHFFVSDVELRRGYGMGRSLLVWLTRDPDVYKTQLTYLQLYRSDDDINMGRVLDSVIEEPISNYLDVEVLYEPENQYLTVAIGGEDKVRYRTWFGIENGIEVALRTLGAAEFSNFRIRRAPSESASIPAHGPYSF